GGNKHNHATGSAPKKPALRLTEERQSENINSPSAEYPEPNQQITLIVIKLFVRRHDYDERHRKEQHHLPPAHGGTPPHPSRDAPQHYEQQQRLSQTLRKSPHGLPKNERRTANPDIRVCKRIDKGHVYKQIHV